MNKTRYSVPKMAARPKSTRSRMAVGQKPAARRIRGDAPAYSFGLRRAYAASLGIYVTASLVWLWAMKAVVNGSAPASLTTNTPPTRGGCSAQVTGYRSARAAPQDVDGVATDANHGSME